MTETPTISEREERAGKYIAALEELLHRKALDERALSLQLAEAWEDGYEAGLWDGDYASKGKAPVAVNPYRKAKSADDSSAGQALNDKQER